MIGNYIGAINPFNPFDVADLLLKKDSTAAQLQKYRYALNSYNQVQVFLRSAGIPANVVPWAAAQIVFETNGFKSRVSKQDLNLSGIKWINKPYQKATQGLKSPEGNYYAKFPSYNAWAADFKRILSIGGANAPINATTLPEYVARLKANKYFTGPETIYLRGLQMITEAARTLQGEQTKEIVKAKEEEAAKKSDWFKKHPLWTGILVAIGAVVVIRNISN